MTITRRKFLQVGSVALGMGVGLITESKRSSAGIKPVRKDSRKRPNILLLFPDQHRFDWLGTTEEIPVRTPHIDRLGRQGVRFTNALCPSPLCAPSRACLAAGKEYDRCGIPDNRVDYPLDQMTFYTLLRESGYHVAGCGKFDLHKASTTWGMEGAHLLNEWGFSAGIDNAGKYDAVNSGAKVPKDPYMAYLHRTGWADAHAKDFRERHPFKDTYPTPLPDEAYCDNWIAQNGLDLLNSSPEDKPWFLQVNFTGPHAPMDITKSMEKLYEGVNFPQPNDSTEFDSETHIRIRQNYSAMVENIDRWVGIYLEELERRGELENTLIIFSSDHGEMLGDHNMWGKIKPFQASVGVPLIISGPGVKRTGASDVPVSVIDLAATFLEYAGLEKLPDMDSLSLKNYLEGKTNTHRDYVFSGFGTWRLVFDGRYKLIKGYGEGGKPILFDLENDPGENINIAGLAVDEIRRLQSLLES